MKWHSFLELHHGFPSPVHEKFNVNYITHPCIINILSTLLKQTFSICNVKYQLQSTFFYTLLFFNVQITMFWVWDVRCQKLSMSCLVFVRRIDEFNFWMFSTFTLIGVSIADLSTSRKETPCAYQYSSLLPMNIVHVINNHYYYLWILLH